MTIRSVLALLIISAVANIVQAADPRDILGPPGGHPLLTGDMPAGVIAATQQRMGYRQPPAPYYQPVQFHGPEGTQFSLAQYGSFNEGEPGLMAGLMIGHVYRFRVTGIPFHAGAELYPTIEMVDRTYPPPGLATTYPIPIHLDQDDILAALEGRLVTRVIFLEDPQTATPLLEGPNGPKAIDVPDYQDPLEIADLHGRTVAILRIGSLAPPRAEILQAQFFFGHPSWAPIFKPQP